MASYSGKTGLVIEGKTFKTEGLTLSSCKDCTVRNCDFSYNVAGDDMLYLSNCQRCTIEDNKFHGKNTVGVTLKVTGAGTKDNKILNNTFYDIDDPPHDNGYEPMRLGNSGFSGCVFNTLVSGNTFKKLTADVETISIKSCGNIIENNEHVDCQSSFVIRHGGNNTIRNNRFTGSGGIRIYGYGNTITGNTFKDNKSSKFPPITLGAGVSEVDPNWFKNETDGTQKPAGKVIKSSHAIYDQVIKNTITDNVFDNCSKTIVTRTDKSLKPKDNTINNNKSGTVPVTEPEVEPQVPVEEPEIPTDPDTGAQAEVPVITPQPDNRPAIVCAIDHEEEGTKRVSVFMCAKHTGLLAPRLQKVINEARKEIEAQEQADKDDEIING